MLPLLRSCCWDKRDLLGAASTLLIGKHGGQRACPCRVVWSPGGYIVGERPCWDLLTSRASHSVGQFESCQRSTSDEQSPDHALGSRDWKVDQHLSRENVAKREEESGTAPSFAPSHEGEQTVSAWHRRLDWRGQGTLSMCKMRLFLRYIVLGGMGLPPPPKSREEHIVVSQFLSEDWCHDIETFWVLMFCACLPSVSWYTHACTTCLITCFLGEQDWKSETFY